MRRYARLDVTTGDRAGFTAELNQQQLAAIRFGRNCNTALAVIRTRKLLRDGDDKLYLTLLETGTMHQAAGQRAHGRPGRGHHQRWRLQGRM